MGIVKFIKFTTRVDAAQIAPKLPEVRKVNGNPFVEGAMTCPKSRKKQQIRISTIRKCLEEGESEAVVRFIEKSPTYLPYVVAAMIDMDEAISFNAEWCVRRLACSQNEVTRILLRHALAAFLGSPWAYENKRVDDEKAIELCREMRDVYDILSN